MALFKSPLAALCLGLSIAAGVPSGAPAQDQPELVAVPTNPGEMVARVIRDAPGYGSALVVGLHGYGMDENQIATLVNVEPASPHALVSLRGAVPAEGGGSAWYPVDDSSGFVTVDASDVRASADQVATAVRHLVADTGADPDKVFLVGFSQGASLVLSMALSHPEIAAGYIAFAGALPPEVRALDWTVPDPAPVLLGYGTRDTRVRAEDIDATVSELADSGVPVALQTFAVPHVVSGAGRRAIADWIDARIGGAPVPRNRPLPIAVTAAPEDEDTPAKTLEQALLRAEARGGHFGNPDGDLVIYKFFDFNCSICRIAHRQMPRFLSQLPDNTRVVAVDVPLLGPGSREASALTFSLGDPDAYNTAYHELMKGRGQINGARTLRVLADLGIETDARDAQEIIPVYQDEMRVNTSAMRSLGISGTPGFLVRLPNGRERAFTGWDADAIAAYINSDPR